MSKKIKSVIADVISDVKEFASEVLTKTEMFLKLFSLVDVKEVKAIAESETDTIAKRVAVSKYLIQVAHDNKLLMSVNSTDTFREMIYNLIAEESNVKSKKFFSAKKLNDKISKHECLEFLKRSHQAKVVMSALYSNLKCCKKLYDLK